MRSSMLLLLWTEGKKRAIHYALLCLIFLHKREWVSVELWCLNKLFLFLKNNKTLRKFNYTDNITGSWERRLTSWNFKFYKMINFTEGKEKSKSNRNQTKAWQWKHFNLPKQQLYISYLELHRKKLMLICLCTQLFSI